jgi:hypothetical protein
MGTSLRAMLGSELAASAFLWRTWPGSQKIGITLTLTNVRGGPKNETREFIRAWNWRKEANVAPGLHQPRVRIRSS